MYKNMTYQQAKRIRSQSISSVLADQLIMGAGYGAAIKQTASAKFNAKISGIKEKFDPLNIARFLTGGSRLGPAILGKMLGRSRRDIEYFTGRARPVQYRGPKIPGLQTGGSADVSGMSSVLGQILTFLQKGHEQDMILREKENNLREGQKHEDERRHQQLLKALGAGKATATKVVATEGGTSLFDGILKMVQDMIDKAMRVVDWVKDIQWLTKLGGWIRPILTAGSAEAFLSMLPIAAFLAPFMLSANEKDKIRANPNLPEYKDNPFAMQVRGEVKTEGEGAAVNQRKVIKQFRRNEVKDFVDSNFTDEELKRELGNDRKSLKVWLQDNNKPSAIYQAPVSPIASTGNGATPATAVVVPPEKTSAAPVTTQSNKLTVEQSKPSAPAPVSVTPKSSEVSTKTKENLNLGLDAKVTSRTETTTNNKVINNTKDEKRKISMPSVRNSEETFARLIWNSTRVV